MAHKPRVKGKKGNFPDGTSPIATEMWAIDRPTDYPKNARKWTPKAIAKVATSLREFGFRQPIVVDSAGVIVIGHLRRRAARDAGFAEVPVHVAADLSPTKIRQLRLMDNRSHDEAEWHPPADRRIPSDKSSYPSEKTSSADPPAFVRRTRPFLGSGTTLAAAELTERVCCGIELDQKYTDVVIQRWQTLSRKTATLDGDGRTFQEIAVARSS